MERIPYIIHEMCLDQQRKLVDINAHNILAHRPLTMIPGVITFKYQQVNTISIPQPNWNALPDSTKLL